MKSLIDFCDFVPDKTTLIISKDTVNVVPVFKGKGTAPRILYSLFIPGEKRPRQTTERGAATSRLRGFKLRRRGGSPLLMPRIQPRFLDHPDRSLFTVATDSFFRSSKLRATQRDTYGNRQPSADNCSKTGRETVMLIQ
jgi:hypothetical protein